jgi:hypothetical protein
MLQDSRDATDWSFAPPRFGPGLSTTHGGFATGDLGVSPDRTGTGWLSPVIACYVTTTSLLPWRPSCWAHSPIAGGVTPRHIGDDRDQSQRMLLRDVQYRRIQSRRGSSIGHGQDPEVSE